MDSGAVTAAFTGLTFAKDAVQAMIGYKIEAATQAKVSDVLGKLGAAQDMLFALREENFRLQSENGDLRRDLDARGEWDTVKGGYELKQTSGGATVYESVGTPKHYACPACYAHKVIQIIQDRRVATGLFGCPSCEAVYPVNRSQVPPSPGRARGSLG